MTDGDGAAPRAMDDPNRGLAETIQWFGYSVEYVIGTKQRQPSFAYTIGLFAHGHPELLVFGFGAEAACKVLNGISGLILAGTEMSAGTEVVVDFNLVVDFEDSYLLRRLATVERVPNPGQIVLRANQFYGRLPKDSVPVHQLTFDDGHGRFPWDAGYSFPAWVQPRPGTFSA
ncbi:MAG: hypothetical protein QOG10_1724 [Kribbellaceae bacterium]|nr:hypothetical protein [Kribbellaceae bacterium]